MKAGGVLGLVMKLVQKSELGWEMGNQTHYRPHKVGGLCD